MKAVRQATAVAVDGRALLIEGPPGSGKTSIALALIDRGAALIGDDGVTLILRSGTVWAAPPPNTVGLIEVRNVGLAELPPCEAPVALVLRLTDAAPRLPDGPGHEAILGTGVPALLFHPGGAIPALRAEWALRIHGLPIAAAKAQAGGP